MKRVLVTGAQRGLGKYIASFLSKKGYSVCGTTRNVETTKDSDNLKFYYLDLCDENSIDQLLSSLLANGEEIDILIHNSGIAYLDPVDVLSEDEIQNVFNVNFFGPISLTKKLLPIWKKKDTKKNLIFISSIVSIDHWPYLGVYASSKNAIETIAFEWAVLLKKWKIQVSVIQPNPLPTDMQIFRSINTSSSPYPELNNRKLEWEDVTYVCDLLLKIITAKNPKFLYQTGPFSKKTAQRFLKLKEYQRALEEYQSKYS